MVPRSAINFELWAILPPGLFAFTFELSPLSFQLSMPFLNQLFYTLKPLIPRRVQLALRRPVRISRVLVPINPYRIWTGKSAAFSNGNSKRDVNRSLRMVQKSGSAHIPAASDLKLPRSSRVNSLTPVVSTARYPVMKCKLSAIKR
jgi:hypothetical protein